VLASHGESAAGDPLRLASRILSALLAGSLGEGNERLSQLSDSLSAMKAYLAGMGAYRKGQLSVAHDHFRTALEIDTTFAAAAFWWSMSTIDPLGPVKLAADKALWSRRDRLSRRDHTIVATIWSHGPRYPEASTVTDFFAAYETAARANPDRPEPWLAWGNALAAYGTQIGIEDYETRAATILDSALALDSTLVPVLDARLKHAVRMRDTATVRKLAVRRSAMVGVDSESTILNEWLIALSLGDSAGRVVTTQRMRQATLPPLLFALSPAVLLGVPLADLEAVAKNRPGPVNRFDIASIRGRVRDALALADSLPVSGNLVTRSITTMVTLALVEPGYDDAARRSLRHPEAFADTAFGGLYRSYCKCFDELWRAREGKARNARAAADQIRRDMRGVEGRALSASVGPLEVCPLLIEFEASRGGSGEARALERLDSLVRLGAGRDLTAVLANLVIADWREKRGDYKGARGALRRRIAADHRMYYLTAPAYLRAEGRVSALLADTAGAIAAYNAYLALRDQPDAGPMQAQVAQVRDHLVQLLSARVGWSARR
jgi:tetratricopeptide (TPR) repeat protein